MIFSSSRSTLTTTFRNLHTQASQPRGQLSELWERATGSLDRPAKRQVMPLTWRGSGALEEASIDIASEPRQGHFINLCLKGLNRT